MASNGKTDWVSVTVGSFLLVALLICAGAFAVDRIKAAAFPKEHAAAQAQIKAQRDRDAAVENALKAEEEKAQAEKDAAEREEAQAFASANEAVQAVRYSLADPDSALFKDVWAVRGQIDGAPEGVFTCGTVNAKNGFGGYVGYMPFVAVGSTVLTPQDGIFEQTFQRVCLEGKKLFPVQV
ncbi:hypothetical protein [Caulobacter sp.]|uniref:hypothetical protein n=1 Tax=Caulobacter sp. TaxID=78 RepID=UPI0031D6D585